MVVNGLEVFRLHGEIDKVLVLPQPVSDFPHHVFHEHGVRVSLLGDEFLVLALEQGVHFAGGGLLHQPDQVLDPEELLEAHLHPHLPPLVVGPHLADFLAAGAQGGNGHGNAHHQINVAVPVQRPLKGADIFHESPGLAYRRGFIDEIREGHLDVGALGVKALPGLLQDAFDVPDADVPTAIGENLDEAAHVGAFVPVGEVDVHVNAGHGVLGAVELVQDHDGVGNVFHPHLVDVDSAEAGLLLHVGDYFRRADAGESGFAG